MQKNTESRWGAQQLMAHPFAYAGRDGRALKELIAEAKAEVTEVIEAEVNTWVQDKNMLLFRTFYSSKNPEKCIAFSTKILSSKPVFKIDISKQCLLSTKSSY